MNTAKKIHPADTGATAGGSTGDSRAISLTPNHSTENHQHTATAVSPSVSSSPLSPSEEQEYERCCEIIKKGPRTPEAIGEPLLTIERRRLYRDVVGDMATFLGVCVQLKPEEGIKLMAEWEKMTGHKDSISGQPRRSASKRGPLPELVADDEPPDLDPDVKGLTRSEVKSRLREVGALHNEVLGAARTSLPKAIRIGEILSGFKPAVGHGNWLGWLAANVSFSERTARNYIRVFEHRTELKSAIIADLTDAYRLLAEPMDATEEQANTDMTGATETTEANKANDDAESMGEATETENSTKQAESRPARKTKTKSAKAKIKKGQAKHFKKLREAVPDDWVEKVKGDISGSVGRHATDCQRDPAKMLAVADVLRKCAAQIEEEIAGDSTLAR
jgi:F0F1-type ATP synthase membrane subunit b/b'